MLTFPLHLKGNREGVLQVPSDLSPADYELLTKQIEMHMQTILDTAVKAPAESASAS